MKLSLVVIAKNEEHDIARCLDSVPFAQEKLVIDSGSTDATVELAEACGAVVLQHDFRSYSEQKSWGFMQASGDWILSLDADESLSAGLASEMESVLNAGTPDNGFLLPFRIEYMGRLMRFGPWSGERHLRLFRRGSGRMTDSGVHEGIEVPSGSTSVLCGGHVLHRSFSSVDEQIRKMVEYSRIWAEEKHSAGERSGLLHILLRPAWRFFSGFVLRGGFLEGLPGFIASVISAFYVFLKWSDLYDMRSMS